MRSSLLFPEHFSRRDQSDDQLYYKTPRRRAYLGDRASAALKELLLQLFQPGGVYLDLMSGWHSHIPDPLKPDHVIGLGLNAQEMFENDRLDEFVVHDLNRDPSLPFQNSRFDAVLCTASVQYLVRPIDVFREVNRVLKPGSPFVVAFGKDCFPRKTIAIWLVTTPAQRTALVARYFRASSHWDGVQAQQIALETPGKDPSAPLCVIWAKKTEPLPIPKRYRRE